MTLTQVKIENYRCFQSFELNQLGKVNLLVGENNSGKTSVLEAIQILCSQSVLVSVRDIMRRRGEFVLNEEKNGISDLDISHLFYGHKIDVGSKFTISAKDIFEKKNITFSIDHIKLEDHPGILQDFGLTIRWAEEETEKSIVFPLSFKGGLNSELIRLFRADSKAILPKTQFVTSSSLTNEAMVEFFDQVVLLPEESLIMEALQTIEPRIIRIASVSDRTRIPSSHSGFVVRLKDSDQRIPIGSMGDGIWRLLGLTLAIVNAKDGILLVDEIDTGLHFRAMSDMWRLIWETAKRLNVQVFATTHNSDCWKSLAAIASTENPSEQGITIHRIEKDKPHSIVFTERQIVIAAENEIEVR